ncbi:MAG: DUF4058 family protein [Planctomycetaceae bacterium]
MPVHDWSRVVDGLFHDFHQAWIIAIRDALNERLLPADFYALAEQVADGPIPDVLALERIVPDELYEDDGLGSDEGGLAVETAPPRVAYTIEGEREIYSHKASRIAVYHRTGDRVVAYVEIISAGNKHNLRAMTSFLKKVRAAIDDGLHLLIIDLHPPTSRDPHGLHHAIWQDWYGDVETPGTTDDKPFTLVSYRADYVPTAYFEPVGLGQELPPMPLFYTTQHYVNVPLEETYLDAWRGVPRRWKGVIAGNP